MFTDYHTILKWTSVIFNIFSIDCNIFIFHFKLFIFTLYPNFIFLKFICFCKILYGGILVWRLHKQISKFWNRFCYHLRLGNQNSTVAPFIPIHKIATGISSIQDTFRSPKSLKLLSRSYWGLLFFFWIPRGSTANLINLCELLQNTLL